MLDYSRGVFYFLSDVFMLGGEFGVRLLTKYDNSDGSCLSVFVFTKFEEGYGECCFSVNKAKDLETVKGGRDIFHMWIGAIYDDDELKLDKKGLMRLFDNLIKYTERLIRNHVEGIESGDCVNHLQIFNDKEGLIRKLYDQLCFRRMKIFPIVHPLQEDKLENNEYPITGSEKTLFPLIQKKISKISHEKAKRLYDNIMDECINENNDLTEYKLNNLVLRTLLDNYGLSNHNKAYFFTATTFYNKFKNNASLKSLSQPLSENLAILYNKRLLAAYDKKINNNTPIYYLKKN
jgi:hypothetical protein